MTGNATHLEVPSTTSGTVVTSNSPEEEGVNVSSSSSDQLHVQFDSSSKECSKEPSVENDLAWYYGMATFDSEWEVGKDSALCLSYSEQNCSTNDFPTDQPQCGPQARFGCGIKRGLGWGAGRGIVGFVDETVPPQDLPS